MKPKLFYTPVYYHISDLCETVNEIIKNEVLSVINSAILNIIRLPTESERKKSVENFQKELYPKVKFEYFEKIFQYSLDYENRDFFISENTIINLVETTPDYWFFEKETTCKDCFTLMGEELLDVSYSHDYYQRVPLEELEEYFKVFLKHKGYLIKNIVDFVVYSFFLQYFNEPKEVKLIIEPTSLNQNKVSLPYQIALLNELGFFELERIKHLPKEKVFAITAKLLNADGRSVKGNYHVLNPKSEENRQRFTSYNYMSEVKNYLDRL